MKLFGAACAALLVGAAGAASTVQRSAEAGRTITQVVKLLQSMLDKSKADGDTERTLYAKYKCYCDTSSADKKAEIEKLTEEIALLESKIDELQSSTGGLSQEVAKLDKDIAANKQAQEEATAIRKRENEDFLALEKDLTDAIGQMKRAIKTLAEVGADQTLASAADHKQYMAGHEGAALVEVKNTLRQALLAANAFVSPKQAVVVDAFLQAPFTGTYTAQSGEVVGILKNMLDTFEANLAAATKTEAEQLAAHEKYMAELEEALKAMEVVDISGLDEPSMHFLVASQERCDAILQWIRRLIVENMRTGVIPVPPPILTRVFQELSRGHVGAKDVQKIAEFPFPFPYTQLMNVLLLVQTLVTPLIATAISGDATWAPVITFAAVLAMWSTNYTAAELEQPFGEDVNDLPIAAMMTEMNLRLRSLLDERVKVPPDFSGCLEMAFPAVVNCVECGFVSTKQPVAGFQKARTVESFRHPSSRRTTDRSHMCMSSAPSQDSICSHPMGKCCVSLSSVSEAPEAQRLKDLCLAPPPEALQMRGRAPGIVVALREEFHSQHRGLLETVPRMRSLRPTRRLLHRLL